MIRTLEGRRQFDNRVNLPNAITVAGYVSSIAWLMGGPKYLALLSILADEIDGRVARATGQETMYGSLLDWAVDLTLTGATAAKAGLLWTLPPVTLMQTYLREKNIRPEIGSARDIYTIVALLKDASASK